MDESPPENPPRHPPAEPLAYEAQTDELRRVRRIAAERQAIAGGCLASLTALVSAAFYGIGLFEYIHIPSPRPPAEIVKILVMPGLLMLSLAGLTAFQFFKRHNRAFAAGVLIGLGVAALVAGACFIK